MTERSFLDLTRNCPDLRDVVLARCNLTHLGLSAILAFYAGNLRSIDVDIDAWGNSFDPDDMHVKIWSTRQFAFVKCSCMNRFLCDAAQHAASTLRIRIVSVGRDACHFGKF